MSDEELEEVEFGDYQDNPEPLATSKKVVSIDSKAVYERQIERLKATVDALLESHLDDVITQQQLVALKILSSGLKPPETETIDLEKIRKRWRALVIYSVIMTFLVVALIIGI